MDPISYSKASQQEQRIKKFVAEPDMTSGLVTVPSVVASGETVSIPAGRTLVHPNLQVDGTLQVGGTLFIPSGGSVSTTEVDATVVKQNGSVVVDTVQNQTIGGVKTFGNNTVFNGNVGVGASSPNTKLHVKGTSNTPFVVETSVSGSYLQLLDNSATPTFIGSVGGTFKVQTSGSGYSDKITIDTSGTVSIPTSGQGLKLPNASSADATTLDWYEEGTFTPTVIGLSTTGVGTYTIQIGNYTRFGNQVSFELWVGVSAHTGTGNMRIAGLPFTSAGGVQGQSVVIGIMDSLTFTGVPSAFVDASNTNIALRTNTSGASSAYITVDTSFQISISGTYRV